MGFWGRYTTASKVRTYTIEYDSGADSASFKADINTYTKGGFLLLDTAILVEKNVVQIVNHAGNSINTFAISDNEGIHDVGEKFIVTLDSVGKTFSFYYREDTTYIKSAFTLDYKSTAIDGVATTLVMNDYEKVMIYVEDNGSARDITWYDYDSETFSEMDQK